jgi:cysteine-rich repeat protein
MRTLPWFALLGLAACHQYLPPLDDDTGDSTTGSASNVTITTLPPPTTEGTTEVPTSSSSSSGEFMTETDPFDPTTVTNQTGSTGSTTDATTDSSSGTTEMAVCGDGEVMGDEACDLGPKMPPPPEMPDMLDMEFNSDVLQGMCRTNCQEASCGDGIVDWIDDEQCDDGNTVDGDGCSGACTFEPVDTAACGDGSVTGDEVCDDGNTMNGDACDPTCRWENTTELFVGTPGMLGIADGIGPAAKIHGEGAMVLLGDVIYLADGANDAIRRIDIATGAVTTIAGSMIGTPGFQESATGLSARFNDVEAITTDGADLYVGDRLNLRLRKVSLMAPHAVSTVAGNGQPGFDDGFGTAATVGDIRGLTYYKGKIYMVDSMFATLRVFDPVDGFLETIAGSANDKQLKDGVGLAARFEGPRHMIADGSGLLLISDSDGATLRYYNTATGFVGTLTGTGTRGHADDNLFKATLARPRGLATDGTSVFFGEFDQNTVRQLVLTSQQLSTNLGQHCNGDINCMGGYTEGTGTAALLDAPFEVLYYHPDKVLYVLDSDNSVLRRVH